MKNNNLIALIISILFYSITALAYLHSNFATKDSFDKLYDTVISIDQKLDDFILRDK